LASYIGHQTHSLASIRPLAFLSIIAHALADQYSSALRNPSPLASKAVQ